MTKLSGGCMCGAVRWVCSGRITRKLVCHCRDCQRATSAPFTAFVGLKPGGLIWQGEVNHYESSHRSYRGFCPSCGTRLYFRSEKWAGEIHLHAAIMDDYETFVPDRYMKCADSPDLLRLSDDRPKLEGFDIAPCAPATG